MTDKKRIFATSRIGDPAENRLRERGYELEVFQGPRGALKKLIARKLAVALRQLMAGSIERAFRLSRRIQWSLLFSFATNTSQS